MQEYKPFTNNGYNRNKSGNDITETKDMDSNSWNLENVTIPFAIDKIQFTDRHKDNINILKCHFSGRLATYA